MYVDTDVSFSQDGLCPHQYIKDVIYVIYITLDVFC